MESTKRLRYLSDEQVDALFRIVFAYSPTTLSPNDMWELRRIGLILIMSYRTKRVIG